jgi:hypothetical protein
MHQQLAAGASNTFCVTFVHMQDRGRRAMPMGNKACNERHVRKCQDLHRQQLATVKSTIDNGPPKSTKKGALTTNAKKQQIMVSNYISLHVLDF